MRIGIEKMTFYAARAYLPISELAVARGVELDSLTSQQLIPYEARTVVPAYEDAVTLAVNAAQRLLTPRDREDVELVVVATESGVDYGKPLSTWVHRFCGLPSQCRNFEVKHMCYGGTAALRVAASVLSAECRPGKKALVISADLSRPRTRVLTEDEGLAEFMAGGCAVAMLVSAEPGVLELEVDKTGFWTNELSDALRPTSSVEIITGQLSFCSYLDGLEEAYRHYESRVGAIDFSTYFNKHVYHAPFPGMPCVAHRTMLRERGIDDDVSIERSYRDKVAGGNHFGRRLGSAYGASPFVSLLGLLRTSTDLRPGDRISMYAYGSGCQAEFSSGLVGADAQDRVRALDLDGHLDERTRLSVAQYEAIERARERMIDGRDGDPLQDDPGGVYAERYAGRGLLVLQQVRNYRRTYGWA
jgi:hydroxymethylglutaryl-CoA synthase